MTARTQTEAYAHLCRAIEDAGRVLDAGEYIAQGRYDDLACDPPTPSERDAYDDDAARDAYYADQPEVAFIDEHPKWGKR